MKPFAWSKQAERFCRSTTSEGVSDHASGRILPQCCSGYRHLRLPRHNTVRGGYRCRKTSPAEAGSSARPSCSRRAGGEAKSESRRSHGGDPDHASQPRYGGGRFNSGEPCWSAGQDLAGLSSGCFGRFSKIADCRVSVRINTDLFDFIAQLWRCIDDLAEQAGLSSACGS